MRLEETLLTDVPRYLAPEAVPGRRRGLRRSPGTPSGWTRLRVRLAGRPVLATVLLVVVLQAAVNAALLSRSYFFAEDLIYLYAFDGQPLDTATVTQTIFGHLVPGLVLVQKYVGTWFGASWVATSVLTVVVQAGGTVAFARLVVALRGWTWWVPWVVTAYALGVVTLNTTPWWSATLSPQIAVIASISTWGCALRFDRTRRWRHLLSVTVMFVLAVSFLEKSIAVCVYLGLFVLLVGTHDATEDLRARLRRALGLWPLWLVLAAVSAVDLTFYLRGTYLEQAGPPAGAGQTADYLLRSLPEGVFPSLVGAVDPLSVLPGPPFVTPVVATAAVLLVIGWTSLRSRLALRAWCWYGLAVLVSQLLVARGRLDVMGTDVVVHNLRYQVDAAYLFLVALTVALPAAAATLSAPVRGRVAMAAALVPLLAVPLWGQSVRAISDDSPGRTSRTYFAAVRAGEVAQDTPFLDLPVPGWIVPPVMYPGNMLGQVLPLVAPGTATTYDVDHAQMLRYDGRVGPAQLIDLTTPTSTPTCVLRREGPTPILVLDELPPSTSDRPLVLALEFPTPRPATIGLYANRPEGLTDVRSSGHPFEVTGSMTSLATVVIPPGWSSIDMAVSGRKRLCVSDVRLVTPAG